MPNTYACKLVSNPNVPIFLPRVCTLVLFILGHHSLIPCFLSHKEVLVHAGGRLLLLFIILIK